MFKYRMVPFYVELPFSNEICLSPFIMMLEPDFIGNGEFGP